MQLQQRVTVWPEAGSPWRSDTGAPRVLWPTMEPLTRPASAGSWPGRPLFFGASLEVVRERWKYTLPPSGGGAAHYAYRGQDKTSNALKGLRN